MQYIMISLHYAMLTILAIRSDLITFLNAELVCYLDAIHKVFEQLNST